MSRPPNSHARDNRSLRPSNNGSANPIDARQGITRENDVKDVPEDQQAEGS
jgi:hypothetical protein